MLAGTFAPDHHIAKPVTQVVNPNIINRPMLTKDVPPVLTTHHHHVPPTLAPAPTPAIQIPNLKNVLIKSRWRIANVLGKGAFGEVYAASDMSTLETVAIKIEVPECKKQVLKLEICVMRKLQACPYVARFVGCGRFATPQPPAAAPPTIPTPLTSATPPTPITPITQPSAATPPIYSYLVMQLLGPNLSDLRRKAPGGQFSISATSLLCRQMLRAVQALHEIGFLHRDIKPGNFCLGPTETEPTESSKCYMIDFGLSRRFMNSTGRVREARHKVGFRGTARYASLAAHEGRDLGRVDDLWSLFYILVECLRGSLPWRGKERSKIAALKATYTHPRPAPAQAGALLAFPHGLLDGLPVQCWHIYRHLMTLGYRDRPDYDYIHAMLDDMRCGTILVAQQTSLSSLASSHIPTYNANSSGNMATLPHDDDQDQDMAFDDGKDDDEDAEDDIDPPLFKMTPSSSGERMANHGPVHRHGALGGPLNDAGCRSVTTLIQKLNVADHESKREKRQLPPRLNAVQPLPMCRSRSIEGGDEGRLGGGMDVDHVKDRKEGKHGRISLVGLAPRPPVQGRVREPFIRRKLLRSRT
ncbi:hypothetical protein SeMB42_g01618 [Synchytrium endobioticum]|uniref:non-specific serine/threonine protein kinase n=1 Tax=Synchytrium endobioticum TaxID=286115 RepID=A0A507CFX8_9FUNG|nr:hypothetical protein SeLEV6574_g06865 [Synchytrium endobioticum]TPX52144.1 hypothetical protein SeMB42_g01618 [Synchytrium endobioticum]